MLNFPVVCSPHPKRIDLNIYPHLQDLELADRSEIGQDAIDILIGWDYYWDIVAAESIWGENGPTAINSKFGRLLSGPTNSSPCETNVVSNLIIVGEVFLNETNETSEIKNVLKTFWETESVGMVDGINSKINCQLRSSETKKHPSTVSTMKLDCRVRRIACPCQTTMECAKHVYNHWITNWRRIRIHWLSTTKLFKINLEIESSKGWQIQTVKQLKVKGTHYSPYHPIHPCQNLQIVMQGNSQDYKSRRSVAFSYRQTKYVELHHRTSSMVAWPLGTISSKCETTSEEGLSGICVELRQTKHFAGWDLKRNKFKAYYVCLRWWRF